MGGVTTQHENNGVKAKKANLFNAFALAKVWRARVLEAIKQHPTLSLDNLNKMPETWVVDCKKSWPGGVTCVKVLVSVFISWGGVA